MGDPTMTHLSLVERMIALARRLAAAGRPHEAAELLEISATLSPQGPELREEAQRLHNEEELEDFDREFKRRNLEASHALGMAHIFESRGELQRAIEMVDLAKLRTPFNYLAYAAAAFFYLRHEDPEAAVQELNQARRLNPLDYRLAVESSRVALETESYEAALEHALDAMLLAQWRSEKEQEQDRLRLDTLVRLCQVGPADLDGRIRKRATLLQKASDHVALSHARLFSGARVRSRRAVPTRPRRLSANLLERATELRAMGIFRHIPDDQLVTLARLVQPVDFGHAQVIFREEDQGRDIFLLRSGTVHVTRKTPVGTQVLSTLGFGAMLGEVSYLDRLARSATAFGVGDGSLYLLPAADLDTAGAEDRDLAVSLLWSFWQTLADKVRAANAQMSELFEAPVAAPPKGRATTPGDRVQLGEKEKLDLLREQGLSAQELRLLATYSREERFPAGALIFAEGERGDTLYIVVEGRVRISRMVPGMGEECLAILDRGEVFGEMALIDEQPRSADARSHQGGTTVFSISAGLLQEVLSMDPDAAAQFLTLLCRLLCRRLRAMNERLVAWRVMACHT